MRLKWRQKIFYINSRRELKLSDFRRFSEISELKLPDHVSDGHDL